MREITGSQIVIRAYDYYVYKQERNVLRCTVDTSTLPQIQDLQLVLTDANNNALATYETYNRRRVGFRYYADCNIEVSDLLRAGYETLKVCLYKRSTAATLETLSVPAEVVGLVAPARLFAPAITEVGDMETVAGDDLSAGAFIYPRMMFQPKAGETLQVVAYGVPNILVAYAPTQGLHIRTTAYCFGEQDIEGVGMTAWDICDLLVTLLADCLDIVAQADDLNDAGAVVAGEGDVFTVQWEAVLYPDFGVYFATAADAATAQTTIDAWYAQNYSQQAAALSVVTDESVVGEEGTVVGVNIGTTYPKEQELADDTLTVALVGDTDSDDAGAVVALRRLRPLLCGRRYLTVEWTGATGATKRHVWEFKDHKIQQGDTVELLLTGAQNYALMRGRSDAYTLALDGLTAADMWYYGDIVSSPRVAVLMDGVWYTVKVTTKDVAVPDGDAGGYYELNINVTFDEYDAVNM